MTDTKTVDLQTPIENLEITVRAFNALKGIGVHTVGDLIKLSETELLNIRNFGTGSVLDIRIKLTALGVALKEGPPVSIPSVHNNSEFKTHENKMRRYAGSQGLILIKSPRRDPRARGFGQYVLVPDDRSSLKDPIEQEVLDDAHLKLDRGDGLTINQVEQELGYGFEENQ